MKQSKKHKITYKKYILVGIFVILTIVAIISLAISANAETDEAEVIKDEKTLVKMSALISRGNAEDDKVNSSSLAEILENYVGSGKTTVTEKDENTLVVTFLETGREYEVAGVMSEGSGDSGDDEPITGVLPSTEYTTPYLPTGFSYEEGDLDTGLVIADSSGNEYVWVEVPRNTTVYSTAGLNITSFTDTEYETIEANLRTYSADYSMTTAYGTEVEDEYSSEEATGLTSDEYYALKKKMLKSIYQNGGFYIGRYETGIANSYREYGEDYTTEHPITETAVVQANAYPYNWVRRSQAQELASGMASGGYSTSLPFGLQWDLIMKYLKTKNATTDDELKTDSTSWGNYYKSTYSIVDSNVKYNVIDRVTGLMSEWLPATTYNKSAEECTLLTTGSRKEFSKMNIYDLAGNLLEWTLEYAIYDSSIPCWFRGGECTFTGIAFPAYFGLATEATYTNSAFRVQTLTLLKCSN